jgi:hypothetical protein
VQRWQQRWVMSQWCLSRCHAGLAVVCHPNYTETLLAVGWRPTAEPSLASEGGTLVCRHELYVQLSMCMHAAPSWC